MEGRIINIDPEILGGTPVFFGTRVPIKNLFDYLESGESIDYFLDDFEGVQREQVIKVLEMSQKLIETSSNIMEDVQTQSGEGLSLSDFSFSKSQKNLENYKGSFSDAVIEERRFEL